jgi:hypothetical protein
MASVLLNTGTASFSELIGNGKTYIVPPFQRDYAWEEEYWDDLWFDILGLDQEPIHYMGYVVLQSNGQDNYAIIDGQQRLTTLSIISLAILKNLEDLIDENVETQDNKQRIAELRNRFLGYKNPASLIATSKLVLNKNNDSFYQSYLLQLRTPTNISKLKPSEKKLWGAFQYFYNRIKEHFKSNRNGAALASFLNDKIAKNLSFTTITVSDELNAYKVFETLNARGVKLSTTDLLKNYLFSIVAKSNSAEFNETERRWQYINESLRTTDFPTFLRHYWNSRHPLERKQTLFKAIRKNIKTRDDVFSLLENLEKLAPIYVAFTSPADSVWTKEQSKHIDELTLFNVSQCFSLLLSAYEKFEDSEFAKLLRACAIISFRYNVIGGQNPNVMEDVYNKTAIKIFKKEATSYQAVLKELNGIYQPDEKFKNDFELATLSSKRYKKLLRYILFSLENHIGNADYSYEDATATVEHILPENPKADWDAIFPPEEQENFLYRLANYTLLEKSLNIDSGNDLYESKKNFYEKSRYKLTNPKSLFTEWTPATLRKRQEELAKIATAVWRLDF